MTPAIQTDRATVHNCTWLELADTLPNHIPNAKLAIVDGPYNMHKADWDTFESWDAFVEWYSWELTALSRVLAPSANLYLWGTDTSASALRPLMEDLGWTRRPRITWDKGLGMLGGGRVDISKLRGLYDQTEVCDHYQRSEGGLDDGQDLAYAVGKDPRCSWIREWLRAEWERAGLRLGDADKAMGTNGMAGHYFGRSQWALPTWEAFQTLHRYANEHGPQPGRPYLVHRDAPDLTSRATWEWLRKAYDELRAEYELRRAPFFHPKYLGNIWAAPAVQGAKRLTVPGSKQPLHPCQKPLEFYERMILSSSRPGDLVIEPYGGTLRAAVACQRLPQAQARQALVCEPSAAYIDGVRHQLTFVPEVTTASTQRGLFDR